MASLRYERTTGQTAPSQFDSQTVIEISSEYQEELVDTVNTFLTAITGERTAINQFLDESWMAVTEDTDE